MKEPIRGRWIWDKTKQELVTPEEFHRDPPKRSHLPAPGIMGDTMAPVQSMLDGKLYDSKSALRRTYKRAGVVEIGNDPGRFKTFERPKPDKRAIRNSIEKAEARLNRGELTEATKRRHV